jgi:hypothetical protein
VLIIWSMSAVELVAFVFQVVDGGQGGVEAVGVELVQAANALAGVLGRTRRGPARSPGPGLGDALEEHQVADVVDGVGHVVEPFG